MAMTKAMKSDALINMHGQLFRSGGAVRSRSLAWSIVTGEVSAGSSLAKQR